MHPQRIRIAEPSIGEEDVASVEGAVRSGWISGKGPYVEEFEEQFGRWLGASNTVATSSGTAALHLALVSLGIRPGDEIIIPAFSMAAIPFAVTYTGARPRLVDSELLTWNIDPDLVEQEITSKSKAIIVMHTYGHPANMGPIQEIASKHDLLIIEDACEAHGAEYNGKKVGTIGDVGCFSFYANKIITTGEGGMITTSDGDIAERARLLRDMAFGKDRIHRFEHLHVGFNYRLTNMQAALGLAQLRRVERFVEHRRERARLYNRLLKSEEGVKLPPEATWAKNVYWMYSILVDEARFGINRDKMMDSLEMKGIETRPFFVPVHRQPAFADSYHMEAHPNAEMLSKNGLNLPSGNKLTEQQVELVVQMIVSLRGKYSGEPAYSIDRSRA